MDNTVVSKESFKRIVKDVKSTYHYSTCVFTKVTCGDLDLD